MVPQHGGHYMSKKDRMSKRNHRRKGLGFLGLWLLGWILVAVPTIAQVAGHDVRGMRRIDVPDPVRERYGFDAADSAGLFVGVRDFEDRDFTEVPYAVDDAVDLAHLFVFELDLILPGRVVLCLAGVPEKPESQQRLEELLEAGATSCDAGLTEIFRHVEQLGQVSGKRGLFVVSVASHGLSAAGTEVLVARDSRYRLLTQNALTGVPLGAFLKVIEEAGAPRQLVMLDACRESVVSSRAGGADPNSAMGQIFADAIASARGQAVLMGTVIGGYSYNDHERRSGVFTAALIDGLRGHARGGQGGLIRVDDLADFANQRVASWVARNHPADTRRGITRQLGGKAARLPLAVDPGAREEAATYRQRRDGALALLRNSIGEEIKGSMYDALREYLSGDLPPTPDKLEWLTEIERLADGTVTSRRAFAYFYNQRFQTAPPPPVGIAPSRGGEAAGGSTDYASPGRRVEEIDLPDAEPSRAETSRAETSRAEPTRTVTVAKDRRHLDLRRSGDLWTAPYSRLRFRYLEEGTFERGSPTWERERGRDEMRHRVAVSRGFWISETEVTQGVWKWLMGNNPSRFQGCGDDCPVETVTWYEALAFANALSKVSDFEQCYELRGCTGKAGTGMVCESADFVGLGCQGYRLPTEAEWEYAARGGTKTPFNTGDDLSTAQANYDTYYPYQGPPRRGSGHRGTAPVRSYPANAWGLYEVHGNVEEWVWDAHTAYPDTLLLDPAVDGTVEASRVYRGGSWASAARFCRSASRGKRMPGDHLDTIGFRVARTVP